jgi:hypothetical protein
MRWQMAIRNFLNCSKMASAFFPAIAATLLSLKPCRLWLPPIVMHVWLGALSHASPSLSSAKYASRTLTAAFCALCTPDVGCGSGFYCDAISGISAMGVVFTSYYLQFIAAITSGLEDKVSVQPLPPRRIV